MDPKNLHEQNENYLGGRKRLSVFLHGKEGSVIYVMRKERNAANGWCQCDSERI